MTSKKSAISWSKNKDKFSMTIPPSHLLASSEGVYWQEEENTKVAIEEGGWKAFWNGSTWNSTEGK